MRRQRLWWSKECFSALRKYLQGGHSKHKDKELKIRVTTAAVTTAVIQPPLSSTSTEQSNTCGVLKCDEIRVKQCTQADCLLWVCELHGMRDHESHSMQMRKETVVDLDIDSDDEDDDEATQESLQSSVSKKSRIE